MNRKPILEVKNLHQRFPIAGSDKVVRALNGVDLTLYAGETLSLVGESGSGKTTVGRAIAGLITPSEGEILYEGIPLDAKRNIRSPALRGKIQMVFQEPSESLDPRMSVRQSLQEPLIYLGLSRGEREARVREVARMIDLTPAQLDTAPSELSAGVQQRVGIGRAIITRPSLIILDEPTSALDPTARAETVDLLFSLQRDLGTAYLFISHDLSTVRHISHDVAVLYLGGVVEQGPASAVFAKPRHPYSSVLLASALLPHPSLQLSTQLRLEGEIPSPIDLPEGCTLAGRCPFSTPECSKAVPPVSHAAQGHVLRCFNADRMAEVATDTNQFDAFQALAERILGQRGLTIPLDA